MAHYAEIIDGVVQRVIVASEEFISKIGGTWIQTSYNTLRGVHYGQDGKPDDGIPLRLNYAAPGMLYRSDLDAFIYPKPEQKGEFVLDEKTGVWKNISKNASVCNGFSNTKEIEPVLDIDHLL